MRFGINILARAGSADLREVGKRIEASGFDSMFLPEHTHIPVNGDVHSAGQATQERMKELPDPYTMLTAIAAVTTTLRIGTGISLIAQHDPIAMAKRIATIDQISGGRFMLGVGAGWNRTEALNHKVSPKDRWATMRENVLAMKQIWSEEQASFHGRHVDFDNLWSWPKPAQKPWPPVIVGGEGPSVLDRVLDYGDMWGPHPVPGITDRIRDLRSREAHKDAAPTPVTLFNVPTNRATIESYAEAGAERCVLYIYDDGPGTIEAKLAEYEGFIRAFDS